jgi:hypothetical protein
MKRSRVVGPMTRAAQVSPLLSTRQLSRRPEALGSREETHFLVSPASDLFSLSLSLSLSLSPLLARSLVSLFTQTAVNSLASVLSNQASEYAKLRTRPFSRPLGPSCRTFLNLAFARRAAKPLRRSL